MIQLETGNVLLKPSHRKQLMGWLRRTLKLGSRFGQFALTITLHRSGRIVDVRARIVGACGEFDCHARRHDWKDALRDMVRTLSSRLHQRHLLAQSH